MNETKTTSLEQSIPNPAGDSLPPAKRAETSGPTPVQRLEMIHRFQAEAMKRADPLAANLGVLSGDLMLFAFRISEAVEPVLTASVTSEGKFGAFAQQAEMYLRVVRQLDRLAQIERQLPRTTKLGSQER